MKLSTRIPLMLAFLWAGSTPGATFPFPEPIHVTLVGIGANCDTPDLQTAIDAAAQRPGWDRIEIAADQVYTAVALVIDDDGVVELVGGFESCGGVEGSGQTVLSGAGGAPEPVVNHVGSGTLTLRRLRIREGDAIAGAGGVSSTGVVGMQDASLLRLQHIAFEDNVGTLAGGLYVAGGAGRNPKRVEFSGVVRFERNRGHRGGAITAIESSLEPAFAPQLTIADNAAIQGDGGGLLLINSVMKDGFACPLRIAGNSASRHGGGMSLQARAGSASASFGSRRPCVNLFEENVAVWTGGAFHVWADGSVDAPPFSMASATLHLQDSVVRHNVASDGAAIMLRSVAAGLRLAEARAIVDAKIQPPQLAVIECEQTAPESCSMIRGNAALYWWLVWPPPPPDGAPLTVISEGEGAGEAMLEIRHSHIAGNSGRHTLRVEGPNAFAQASDSLLADNETWDGLVDARGQARVAIARSTLTHEESSGGAALRGDSDFVLERSIAIFPGQQPPALRHANNDAVLLDVVLDAGLHAWVGHLPDLALGVIKTEEPGFVDAENANYRLRADSIAIDSWRPLESEVTAPDLDLSPRGIDMPGIGDESGATFDLGAFEYDHGVFDDGFE